MKKGANMKVESTDGVSIAYQVSGHDEPPLVFVHGFCCDRTYWDAQIPYFARKNKVVAIDLAGHGESGVNRETWTTKAFGDDVIAVINELNLRQVILIGHSMGGPVIVEAARRLPDHVLGLVGVDTFRRIDQVPNREEVEARLASLQADFVGAMRESVKGMFLPSSDPILVEKVASDMSGAPPEVGVGMMRDRPLKDSPISLSLKEVKVPIYCIVSDRSPIDIEAVKRHTSSFDAVYMSNVGHFVMMEDPETFNQLLSEIVKKLTP